MPDLGFQESGQGPIILLIHGFPMNSEIWDDFRIPLSKDFKVISIDLPGFGKSPILEAPFTIEDVAYTILQWLSNKNITNCVVIGHSLGGYVTLAMAEKIPEKLAGFCLLHSTAFADTFEKKQSRTKVIEFVKKSGALAFTSNFIPPLFANQNHPSIKKVRSIAIKSSAEAVEGYTSAMRERPERTSVLEKYKKPILFITGEKDAGIPPETILAQSSLAHQPEVHVLKGVAHMGMFEDPVNLVKIIRQFSMDCFR